jgi:hypothetical protein
MADAEADAEVDADAEVSGGTVVPSSGVSGCDVGVHAISGATPKLARTRNGIREALKVMVVEHINEKARLTLQMRDTHKEQPSHPALLRACLHALYRHRARP